MLGVLLPLVALNAHASLAWAGRIEAGARQEGAVYVYWEAQDAYRDIMRKYGRLQPAVLGLARCELGAKNYMEADRLAAEAARRWPTKPNLAFAKKIHPFAVAARTFTKAAGGCMALFHVKVGKSSYWAGVVGVTEGGRDGFNDCALGILRNGKVSIVALKPTNDLGTMGTIADVSQVDLNHDGKTELVVRHTTYGASWSPSTLYVFDGLEGTPRQRAALFGDDYADVEDRDGDGIYEITRDQAVGSLPPHAERPRWPDFFHYVSGKLVNVNRRFPSDYGYYRKELSRLVKKRPTDLVQWRYLAEAEAILGHWSAARKAAKRALALAKHEPAYEDEVRTGVAAIMTWAPRK